MKNLIQDAKEKAIYWYFFFPKWVWTIFILFLIALAHVFVALSWNPLIFVERYDWYWRLLDFYVFLIAVAAVGAIMVLVIAGTAITIYDKLPDDPRKQKGDRE